MASFLPSLHMETKYGVADLYTVILPLLELLTLGLIGLVLAHPKLQLLPKATLKLLTKLIFFCFLPCLIFYNLGTSISLDNITLWWFIPLNLIISTTVGLILGCLVAIVCRPPPQFYRFTIVMTAFGNTGNLPLAIVVAVCDTTDNPFGSECYNNGVAYVSFSQWIVVILACTLVYHMMEPPLEYYEIVEERGEIQDVGAPESDLEEGITPVADEEEEEEEEEEESANDHDADEHDDDHSPLLNEAEWLGVEEKEAANSKTPCIARLFESTSTSSIEEGIVGSPKPTKCLKKPKMVRKIEIVVEKTPIRRILQPVTVASLLAILVGIIPKLKDICFGSEAPLGFITDSFNMISDAMVPSVMLIIGGMLAEGPNESQLGIRTTVGIIIARLLVLPVLGTGVIYLANKGNLLISGDQLYRFVLLLQYTTPSAILLGAIASLRGYAVREASALLFWQHVFAFFSLPLFIIIYFELLIFYL